MPDDISALNDTLNTLNEQRLTIDYERAQQAHQERPNEVTLNALVEAATAQDRFAEARANDIEALAYEVGVMTPEYQALGSVVEEMEVARRDAMEQDTAIADAVGVMESPTSAANFTDEVDAWYQAVQPTGDIRRVRDAELFDSNGYSQLPDAVAVQVHPVSKEFTAMHRPTSPLQRHEVRMQNIPSLATSSTRLPSAGQGPTLPVAAPTMKL